MIKKSFPFKTYKSSVVPVYREWEKEVSKSRVIYLLTIEKCNISYTNLYVQKLVRVPNLAFSQLFGVCFRFHRSEAERGEEGEQAATTSGACCHQESWVRGGGGKFDILVFKGEVFEKKKTFGCELFSNQKYFRPHM